MYQRLQGNINNVDKLYDILNVLYKKLIIGASSMHSNIPLYTVPRN